MFPYIDVTVTQGQGIIRNVSDDFAHGLIIKRPMTINWPDCGGSVGQYYAIAHYADSERDTYTQQLTKTLIDGTEQEIFSSISRFLDLFENGTYQVSFLNVDTQEADFHHDGQAFYGEHVPEDERFTGWFFPGYHGTDYHYFFTRSYDTINPQRVAYYKELILKGGRPKAVIYQHYDCRNYDATPGFIIDGHHKTMAYLELKIPVEVVFISRDISHEDIIPDDILPLMYPVLKPHELRHILNNNSKIYTDDTFEGAFLLKATDEILVSRKSMSDFSQLMFRTVTSTDPQMQNWFRGRLRALSKNNYIGKGLALWRLGPHEKYGQCWFPYPINYKVDLLRWIGLATGKTLLETAAVYGSAIVF